MSNSLRRSRRRPRRGNNYKSKLRQRSSVSSSNKNVHEDNYEVDLKGDINHKWSDGDIVWAKYDDYPWWPAQIVSNSNNKRKKKRRNKTVDCKWFGDGFDPESNECKLINVVEYDPDDMDGIFVEVNEEDISSFQDACDAANNIYQQNEGNGALQQNEDETTQKKSGKKRRFSPPPPLESISNKENENKENMIIAEPPKKRARIHKQSEKKEEVKQEEEEENKTDIFNGKNPFKMKVKELKELCRNRGLKVGGNKTQLIQRLMNPDIATSKNTGTLSVKTVHDILKKAGIDNPERVSNCLKKGIQRQFYKIDLDGDGLDAIICRGRCLLCNTMHTVTIRDCLYQQDYGGDDYECGSRGGAVTCKSCSGLGDGEDEGIYVTGLCQGKPSFDCGKFHNHCCECPGFGKCIGDYREAHCSGCGGHYWAGFGGDGRCQKCERRRGGGFGVDIDDDCIIQ